MWGGWRGRGWCWSTLRRHWWTGLSCLFHFFHDTMLLYKVINELPCHTVLQLMLWNTRLKINKTKFFFTSFNLLTIKTSWFYISNASKTYVLLIETVYLAITKMHLGKNNVFWNKKIILFKVKYCHKIFGTFNKCLQPKVQKSNSKVRQILNVDFYVSKWTCHFV